MEKCSVSLNLHRQGLALCGHHKAEDESGKRVSLILTSYSYCEQELKIIHNSLSGWRSLKTNSQANNTEQDSEYHGTSHFERDCQQVIREVVHYYC